MKKNCSKQVLLVSLMALLAAPLQIRASDPSCNLSTSGAACGTFNGCDDPVPTGPWIYWSCYLAGYRCRTLNRRSVDCSGVVKCQWQHGESRISYGCMPSDCVKNSGCL